MARILLAWELGLGLGHLARLRPIAMELVFRGHNIYLAARDMTQVKNVFGECPLTLLPAAWHCHRIRKIEPVATYADLLLNVGFGDRNSLAAHVDAWRNLFALIEPDLLVCDHSPTALLAARDAQFPVATVGTGFCCPVDESPLRPLREVSPRERPDVYEREQQVLDTMNWVLKSFGLPGLDRVTECYGSAAKQFLMTFAELDHFAERRGGDYRGTWPFGWGGQSFQRTRDGPYIFAYLKPFPALADVLVGLSAKPLNALVYIEGTSTLRTANLRASRVQFADRPVDILQAAEGCDLALTNATHGTGVAMLLAGKPLVQVPLYLEQALFAAASERLGASLTVSPKNGLGIIQAIEQVLNDSRHAQAAANFAERYRDRKLDCLAQEIVEELDQLIAH